MMANAQINMYRTEFSWPYYCTVKVVFKNVWSLVPTLTANCPGSTTNLLLSDHTASCVDFTGIVTFWDSPGLPYDDMTRQVRSRVRAELQQQQMWERGRTRGRPSGTRRAPGLGLRPS